MTTLENMDVITDNWTTTNSQKVERVGGLSVILIFISFFKMKKNVKNINKGHHFRCVWAFEDFELKWNNISEEYCNQGVAVRSVCNSSQGYPTGNG